MPNILEWKKRFFRLDKIHDVFLRLLSVSLFEDGAEVHALKRFSYGGIQRIVDAVRQRLLKILLCISRRRTGLFRQRQLDGGEHVPRRDFLRRASEMVAALRTFA